LLLRSDRPGLVWRKRELWSGQRGAPESRLSTFSLTFLSSTGRWRQHKLYGHTDDKQRLQRQCFLRPNRPALGGQRQLQSTNSQRLREFHADRPNLKQLSIR